MSNTAATLPTPHRHWQRFTLIERIMRSGFYLVALIAVVLLGGLIVPSHVVRALSSDALQTAIQGTAKLVILGPKAQPVIGTCSATARNSSRAFLGVPTPMVSPSEIS